MTPNDALRPGDLLAAAWRLDEVLREGRSGTVFAATDLRLGRSVAVKSLSGVALDEDSIARLEREAALLARLSHPNIVELHTMDRHEGIPYLVMQFIEGQTLAEASVERGGFSEREVLSIAEQVADALAYLHEQGLLHRDIKPSNLMVSKRGHVTLIDLGITRTHDSALTRTGVVHGTPGYMSPEAILAEKHLDGRADLYSLAAVVFELLTGSPPFGALQGEALLRAHLTQPRPKAHPLRPNLPHAVSAVLARAMALEPDGRYPSVRDFVAALRASLEPVITAPPQDAATAPGRPALEPITAPGRDALEPGAAPDATAPMQAFARRPAGPEESTRTPVSEPRRGSPSAAVESSNAASARARPSADALPRRRSSEAVPRAGTNGARGARASNPAQRAISAPPPAAAPVGPLPDVAVTPPGLAPLKREHYEAKSPSLLQRRPKTVWGTLVGVAVALALLAIFWPTHEANGPRPPEALPISVVGMAPPPPPAVDEHTVSQHSTSATAEELEANHAALPIVAARPTPHIRSGARVAPQRLIQRGSGRKVMSLQLGQVEFIGTFDDKPVPALLEVDGVVKGQTPIVLSLAPGGHLIRMDYAKAKVVEFSTNFIAGQSVRLEVELPTAEEVAARAASAKERDRRAEHPH